MDGWLHSMSLHVMFTEELFVNYLFVPKELKRNYMAVIEEFIVHCTLMSGYKVHLFCTVNIDGLLEPVVGKEPGML